MSLIHETCTVIKIDATFSDEEVVRRLNEWGARGWRTVQIERRKEPYEQMELAGEGTYQSSHTRHVLWILLEKEQP